MAQILLYAELKQKRNLKLGLEYLRRAADLACATTTEPALIMGQILIGEFKKVNIPKWVYPALDWIWQYIVLVES